MEPPKFQELCTPKGNMKLSNADHEYLLFTRQEMEELQPLIHITTPLHEIVERIRQIDLLCRHGWVNNDDLVDLAYELVCRVPIPLIELDTTFILRARSGYKDGNKPFSCIPDLSYNPFPKEGRFNVEGEHAFYGTVPSISQKGAASLCSMLECDKDLVKDDANPDDKYISIGRWDLKRIFKVVNFTLCAEAHRNNLSIRRINDDFIRQLKRNFTRESIPSFLYFTRFISEKAALKTEKYSITNVFKAAIQRYYKGDLNGILYASAMTENNGLNVVLDKELVDNGSIQMHGAVVYKIQSHPFKKERTLFPCSNYAVPDAYGNFSFRVNNVTSIFG